MGYRVCILFCNDTLNCKLDLVAEGSSLYVQGNSKSKGNSGIFSLCELRPSYTVAQGQRHAASVVQFVVHLCQVTVA